MKKNLILLAFAAAVAAVVVSCSKEASNDNVVFKATAEPAAENNKVALSGGRLLWQAGDQISVYDASSNSAVFGLASGVGTANAEYSHSSGATLAAAPYSAVYPAAIRTDASTVSLPEVQHTPDGSLTGLPMYAVSDDMELHFYNLCGVVRFRLSASSAVSVSRIAVGTDRNTNGAATISGSGSSVSLSTPGGNNVTTLACDVAQSVASARDFYMYLPAGTYSTFRILMTAADGSLCSKTANSSIVVERGKITTITLSGLTFTAHRFSTSSTESVVFSQGNLQYQASTGTWRFATNQWDVVGSQSAQYSDQYGNVTGSDNANISSSYSGWIDLFGWGTSGWNSGNHYYMPYDYDYSTYPYTEGYGYGPTDGSSYTYSLTGAYANADWGVYNAISNGGNAAGLWRTLTQSEWAYLINTRANASSKWGNATVAGVNGVILLPDSFTDPMKNNGSGAFVPQATEGWSDNVYSADDWTTAMQSAGAVFLPAAGGRYGATVCYVGFNGNYWSSTYSHELDAYVVGFLSGTLDAVNASNRSTGLSVRLVRG